MTTATIITWATANAVPLSIGAALALASTTLAVRALRKRGATLVDTITVLVALSATAYAGTGTLRYLDTVMHYGPDLRWFLVGVLEGAVVVSGLRARRNIADNGSAGVDGVALWVLTGMSGVLSATTSRSLSEALGRLSIPIVGAWLWERLLAPERRAHRAKRAPSVIRWRITRERIAVWLRLADSTDTDVSRVESARRVIRFLRAVRRVERGFRWPLSASARADRTRVRLASHALLSQGDPTEVLDRLARVMLGEALTQLDIASETRSADVPEVSQDDNLMTPAHPEFAEVVASLPPVAAHKANGRKVAAASSPARRQASVTARIGVDRDSAADLYRDSVTAGDPLSSRSLARRTGLSQSTANRVIAEVRKESPTA